MPNIEIHEVDIRETSATVYFRLSPDIGEQSVASVEVDTADLINRGLNEHILGPAWFGLLRNLEHWQTFVRIKEQTQPSMIGWYDEEEQGVNVTYIGPGRGSAEVHFLCQPGGTRIEVEVHQLTQDGSGIYVLRAAWRQLHQLLDAWYEQGRLKASDPMNYLA